MGGHDFVAGAESVGQAVKETFQHYRTDNQSWYTRLQTDMDTSPMDQELAKGTVFSQAVGPEQSNAYLRGKYAALGGHTIPSTAASDDVTPDRPEYLRSKYAVKF